MQSSTTHLEILHSPLGERRGKSDLARFSLDSSWARAVSDSARSEAYPSPPMSGSPPLPPRHNPDSGNRGHGSYGSSGQEVYQGIQTPPLRAYQESHPHQAYPPQARMDESPSISLPYQQRPAPQFAPQMYHQPPHPYPPHPYPPHHPQPPAPFSAPERPPTGDAPDFVSPKAQRKTKGHVASACDAQRPCSRCTTNGKEDACVDVQHKKRGRPRLRDEREQRLGYESMSGSGSGYPHPSEGGMTRPLSMYSSGSASMNADFGGPIAPRYLDHASAADANIYGAPMMPAPAHRMLPQEPPCAYLTMKMQVAKATTSFNDMVGLPGGVLWKNFQDLVLVNEREKVAQLQLIFEDERRQREPHYLPPISLNNDEERIINSLGFGPEVTGQLRFDHSEIFALPIPAPDGSQRSFQARFGLGKRDATYFIAMVIQIPTPTPKTPQSFQQSSLSSPFSRDSYSRGSSSTQYEYHTAQQPYASTQAPPQFMTSPAYGDPREQMTFRGPMQGLGQVPLTPNAPPSTNTTPFPQQQPPSRPEYSHNQMPYQTPRSELPQTQPVRQHDLQLPPIRDQRGEASSEVARRRDDRSNRVDIGGLLENPRGSRGQ
ncbi:hypothetical protein HYALB_00007331 [Hymenoscyphus albidus]|uniref:Zn(2)-C6 fungal-type domain-containing protein n=1 Tax=Hymenoscyphus albidus TaxID=595503 RepID=A0A9N9LH14_9HELO|nr:hypothetical protein HYALB_00007331 [Hymenoscyphus albidus]